MKIEINFDPEMEDIVADEEMRDVRYLRVTIPDRELLDGSLALREPEQSDPGCPVRVRDTPVYSVSDGDGVVEFRAELDVDAICDNWGTVEDAALSSPALPFRFVVGIQKKSENDPDTIERPGELRINLNRITWRWIGLVRDAKGKAVEEGDEQENTTIEVPVDGTDTRGFRLTLELEERQKNGDYQHKEADFTHYLSPSVHEVGFNVLKPDPIPWEIGAKKSKRQITTDWWTQKLDPGSELLNKLPIDTTIRVRAYPGSSIQSHRDGKAPVTNPPDLGQHAMREIPLRLGVAKWKLRVLTPDPAQPPVVLTADKPWEEGFDVEVEIYDDTKPDAIRYLKNKEVEWKLRADSNRVMPGGVQSEGGACKSDGRWTTDELGRIKFKYCPRKENALFLADKNPGQFFAEFDVTMPSPNPAKPGPKIRAAEPPNQESDPSFVIDWAPKFDLSLFKLPFFFKFSDGAQLDPEVEPSEDTVEPLVLELPADATDAYRNSFRYGGTIMLRPVTTWDGEGGEVEIPLRHFRLIIGEASKAFEKRNIQMAGQGGESAAWPETAEIKGHLPPQGTNSSVPIKPKAPLHCGVAKFLLNVKDESKSTESSLSTFEGMSGSNAMLGRDAAHDFRVLASKFGESAVRFFAEEKQERLMEVRKGVLRTLSAMQMFVRTLQNTWSRLAAAVNLHRQTYKRFEDNLLNFYYDFLCWDKVSGLLDGFWQWLRGFRMFSGLPEDASPFFKLNWLVSKGHEKLQGAILSNFLSNKFKPVIDDALTAASKNAEASIRKVAECKAARDAINNALQEAEQRFQNAAGKFGTHADEVMRLTDEINQVAEQLRASGASRATARAQLQPLWNQRNQARKSLGETASELRTMMGTEHPNLLKRKIAIECQVAAEEKTAKSWQDVAEHMKDGQSRIDGFIGGDEFKPDDIGKSVTEWQQKWNKPPADPDLALAARVTGDLDQSVGRHFSGWNSVTEKGRALSQKPGAWSTPLGSPAAHLPDENWDFSAQSMEWLRKAEQTPDELRLFIANTAKPSLDHRIESAARIWEARKAAFDGMLGDGVKNGTLFITDSLRNATDQAPNPPASKKGSGMFENAWGAVKATFWAAIEMIKNGLSWAASTAIGLWAIWLIGFVARLILWPLNMLLRLTARIGAKVCEMCLSAFHAMTRPESWRSYSALAPGAVDAGLGVWRAGGVDTANMFTFPYWREERTLKRMQQAADGWVVSAAAVDRASEQVIEDALKTGYDDYYATEVPKTRKLLYNLCGRVLNVDLLKTPPFDEDPGHRTVLAMNAGNHLERFIREYLAAADRQSTEGKFVWESEFWTPLGRVMQEDPHNPLNLRDFDYLVDWVSWIISWALVLGAILVAISSWWTGAGLVASTGLLATSAAVSAIAGVLRLVVTALGYYPSTMAYPRDALVLQAVHYALIFAPKDQRFNAENTEELVNGYNS